MTDYKMINVNQVRKVDKLVCGTLVSMMVMLTMPVTHAKIGDCPAIESEGVLYISHSDYIEAKNIETENTGAKQGENLLWHTQLFSEEYFDGYNPLVEEDVQWNISCVEKVTDDEVFVTDKMNRQFYVDKETGKLLRTMKDGEVIDNPELANVGHTSKKGNLLLVLAGLVIVIVGFVSIHYKEKKKN